MNAMFPIIY